MKLRILLLIGGLALMLLACRLPFLTTPPPIGEGKKQNILFQDDFSDTKSGWEVGEYDAGEVGYGDGYYYVISYGNGDTMWGVANRSFTDMVIEVDATQVSGPANHNTDYGVICRTADPESGVGYYLLITGDGYYAIAKGTEEGTFEWLADFTESDAIRQGNATNRIRAVCDGSKISLTVNGVFLTEVEDSEFTSGDIALTATSYEDTPVEVHFDNVVVTRP
ncbi:MAG: hypothetical protein RMK65_09840 [Anaerolineae bacterium]|nr:hypothetical protein [Anaerolineae bacterium]MCX8068582.1 hypothetical protein [Anaerolineae bacterium]MDW7992408.1 hypothetical protein [Anaerolineae bacterium]